MCSCVLSVWSCLVVVLWCQVAVGLDGLDTFVDENDIRAVADYLEDRVAYVSEDEPEWRVYPKLTFPCRGRINSISTFAYFDASDATVGVEMQLWMPNTTAGVPGTPAEDSDSFLGDRMESRPFSPSPSEDGGQCGRRYHLLSDSTRMLSAQRERREQGDPPGFQRISLRFEELEVPAEAIIALKQVEGVVLYQRGESGPPSFPVPTDGRGFICHSGSNDGSSDENRDFPLIYVNLRCDDDEDDCNIRCPNGLLENGFVTSEELNEILEAETSVLYSIDETSVIPDLSFTSPGTVLAWQFAGRLVLGDSSDTLRPHIQIWRPTEREKRQAEDDVQYRLIHSTSLRERDLDDDNGIFTYRLESAVEVEIGDAIGVRQPLNSQLFILFDRGGYTNYITDLDTRQLQLDDANTAMRVPLLRPFFQPLQLLEPSSTVTTQSDPFPSMEPSSTVTTQSDRGGVAPALYISVGIICAVLTSVIIVLAITLRLCWKRKKNSMSTSDNVAYGVNQNVVDISDNVAYGVNHNVMDIGDNVAYVASTSGDKDKVEEAYYYDYVVTTEGNEIISTSQNEAYESLPN